MNLLPVFLTGLTVGGLTCLAVQGGLLASVIAAKEGEEVKKGINKRNTVFPTLIFLATKLIIYTIFGFMLGIFGRAIAISQVAQIIMQFAAGLYMIAVALNLLNIHPIFRYAVIQPPKFLTRRVRNQSKSKELFAPALLGLMTILIPCGTTLAIEALAISTSSPFLGAVIMAAFVLGTMPLFFGIGWLTSILGDSFRGKFLKMAAVVVIYLGISSINGALIALDFPINSHTLIDNFRLYITPRNEEKLHIEDYVNQSIEIIVSTSGYSPNYIRIKKGSFVTIKLIGKEVYSCASAFRIPALGISKNLQVNETYTFTFTPKKTGRIRFACSMGMFTGVIEII